MKEKEKTTNTKLYNFAFSSFFQFQYQNLISEIQIIKNLSLKEENLSLIKKYTTLNVSIVSAFKSTTHISLIT